MKHKPKTFSQFLMKEEGITPTNIAGSGAIAGIPPDPSTSRTCCYSPRRKKNEIL